MSDEVEIWLDSNLVSGEDRVKIIDATIAQVKKDFALQGIVLEMDKIVRPNLIHSLAGMLEKIEFLHDKKLTPLLYQLDLNESKIARKLTTASPDATYQVLSESILKRCFEKVIWRQKYQSKK